MFFFGLNHILFRKSTQKNILAVSKLFSLYLLKSINSFFQACKNNIFSPRVDLNDNFPIEKHFQSGFFQTGNCNRNTYLLCKIQTVQKSTEKSRSPNSAT